MTGTPKRPVELQAFVDRFPCIYEGKILCIECPKDGCTHPELAQADDDCDMAAGRRLRQEAFEAGFVAALLRK